MSGFSTLKEYYSDLNSYEAKRMVQWSFMYGNKNDQVLRTAYTRMKNALAVKNVKAKYLTVGHHSEMTYITRKEIFGENGIKYPGIYFKVPKEISEIELSGETKMPELTTLYKSLTELEQVKIQWAILDLYYKRIPVRRAVKYVLAILLNEHTVSEEFRNKIYETYKIKIPKKQKQKTNS